IEISKRSIWTTEQMHQARPDIMYHIVALDRIMIQLPEKIANLLYALQLLFDQNRLKPLPYKSYPVQLAKRAFHFMQRAKQIGKVVITVPVEKLSHPICFRAEGTYLITGGLGGLGLAVADWMMAQGARSLALIGRHTPGEAV